MAINQEPGKNGTTPMLTSDDGLELLREISKRRVICCACKWMGTGAMLKADSIQVAEDQAKAETPISMNLVCPTCGNVVLDFTVRNVPPSEQSAVDTAEALIESFKKARP